MDRFMNTFRVQCNMARRLFALVLVLIIVSGLLFVGFYGANISDQDTVGKKASDLVKGPFTNVLFEVDYLSVQPETVPDENEVNNFLAFARRYTGKEVRAEYSELSPDLATTGHWDEAALRILASKTRNTQSWPFYQLSVHILYVNALFAPPEQGTAGLSIDATTIVVFRGLFAVANPDAEDAVLAHEFGHLMSLCGLGTSDPKEICDGSGHSKDSQSLMAANITMLSPWVQRLELMPDEVELLNAL